MSQLYNNLQMAMRHLKDAKSEVRRHAILKVIAQSCNREVVQIEKDFCERIDRKARVNNDR